MTASSSRPLHEPSPLPAPLVAAGPAPALPARRRALVTVLAVLALLAAVAARPEAARAEAAPAATVGDVYGGFSPDGESPWLSDADLARNLDLMKASGARWVRLGVVWSVVEGTPGVFDWRTSDRVFQAARARGLDVLAILTYTPKWASGSDDDKVAPKDPASIARVAREAAARYAPLGIHTWEIWNEPNLDTFWAPRPDAAAYAGLLQVASRELKAADPSAVVVTGGLAPAGDEKDGSQIAPLTFLNQMYAAGAGPSFDAVGLHPYCYPAVPMQSGSEGWNLFSRAPLLKQAMDRNGDSTKRIWFTEFGAPTGTSADAVTDAVQVQTIRAAFAQLPKWPWAGPLFLYSLRDHGTNGSDREQNFGLLRRDYMPKPSWAAAVAAMHAPAPVALHTLAVAPTTSTAVPTSPVSAATPGSPGTPVSTVAPGSAVAPAPAAAPAGPPVPPAPAAVPTGAARTAAPVRLSALNAKVARNGWGPVERNLSNGGRGVRDGRRLSIRGRGLADGLGVNAGSSLTYALSGGFRELTATVGVDDEVHSRGSVVFEVWSDDVLRYRSSVLTGRSAPRAITVAIDGARSLRLVVRDAGDGNHYDHGDWGLVRLVP